MPDKRHEIRPGSKLDASLELTTDLNGYDLRHYVRLQHERYQSLGLQALVHCARVTNLIAEGVGRVGSHKQATFYGASLLAVRAMDLTKIEGLPQKMIEEALILDPGPEEVDQQNVRLANDKGLEHILLGTQAYQAAPAYHGIVDKMLASYPARDQLMTSFENGFGFGLYLAGEAYQQIVLQNQRAARADIEQALRQSPDELDAEIARLLESNG